jgi:hypothetical protein
MLVSYGFAVWFLSSFHQNFRLRLKKGAGFGVIKFLPGARAQEPKHSCWASFPAGGKGHRWEFVFVRCFFPCCINLT